MTGCYLIAFLNSVLIKLKLKEIHYEKHKIDFLYDCFIILS